MGIREVQEQLNREHGRTPVGGGPYEERQPQMGNRNPRGAIRTPQRASPRIGTQEKLLWMSYVTTGLLAVNVALLIYIVARL